MKRLTKKFMTAALRLTGQKGLTDAMARVAKLVPSPTMSVNPKSWTLPLADVSAFARWPQPGPLPVAPAAATPPDGARFEEHAYADAEGRRTYKLYVPSGYRGQKLPLLIMLHGCNQSPDDFAAGTGMNELAETHLFFVAYPAQSQSANSSKCWNWFRSNDQQHGRGEPSLIAGITNQIMDKFAVAQGQIYVAGLSAGGAAAAVMGATYPDLYAAIGVHSGLACGAASDVPSAFTAMKNGASQIGPRYDPSGRPMPTIVFHGDRDPTVNFINGDQVIAQAMKSQRWKTVVTNGRTPTGANYTCKAQLDPEGRIVFEQWVLHGAGHAWSGGSPSGSYTDPSGPDASAEMVRFFLSHKRDD